MKLLNKGDKVALTACSNTLMPYRKNEIDRLLKILTNINLKPILSQYIFSDNIFSVKPKDKADELIKFYEDRSIKAIFDVSGGDLSNLVLDYLNFNIIKEKTKPFFGYSDLSVLLNAFYHKTNNLSFLYQIRNLANDKSERQIKRFSETFIDGTNQSLTNFKYRWLNHHAMSGIVIGGNIRCFLKLAGTNFMPSFDDRILFLESYGGDKLKIASFFAQLKNSGILKKVSGILLGTFTELEKTDNIEDVLSYVFGKLTIPVAKTNEIGHATDSKCLILGEKLNLN
ncbi:LD-carboxypeptidase [Clostridium sp. BJN0001]|uniref:S66 peptidase family protein n=1 Tax=Clostridium sp. BJN0001 TaxID=2930219 RepID=UPI001FD453CF|nr:LD-carboxypeptidase [Clostridium sp. BJN0001]